MHKPSFFESLKAGAFGSLKGMLILGGIGLTTGALLGGLAGAMGLLIVSEGISATVVGALGGGIVCAEIGMGLGALVGAITGVIQSREGQVPDAQDLINMNNMAFAQGAAAAQNRNVSHESLAELEQARSHFQDRLEADRKNAVAMRC